MRKHFLLLVPCALALLSWAAGCQPTGGEFKEIKQGELVNKPHAHAEEGPHHGHLVELGNHEFHAEVVFDAKDKKLTVYTFGHELDQPLPIESKEVTLNLKVDKKQAGPGHREYLLLQFKLPAAPQAGDGDGKASRFELAGNAEVADHIHDEEDLLGAVSVTINGKPYSGQIEHGHEHGHSHDHAAHEHKDGDKAAADHEHDKDHDHADGDKDHDHEHKEGEHKDAEKK